MTTIVYITFAVTWAILAIALWFAYQLFKQNGRLLLRIEALEAAVDRPAGDPSLAKSRINRNGLPKGTVAPAFTLPLLHGGELSLSDYKGRRVLLVFSDPDCGPCNLVAPQLQKLSSQIRDLDFIMVSRGDHEKNKKKAAELGIDFPIVLQDQWKLSREYARFETPIAYLIDERGVIASDVALGPEAIVTLATKHARH